jgi:hypothetical protein
LYCLCISERTLTASNLCIGTVKDGARAWIGLMAHALCTILCSYMMRIGSHVMRFHTHNLISFIRRRHVSVSRERSVHIRRAMDARARPRLLWLQDLR